jgi:hypothetical protein
MIISMKLKPGRVRDVTVTVTCFTRLISGNSHEEEKEDWV